MNSRILKPGSDVAKTAFAPHGLSKSALGEHSEVLWPLFWGCDLSTQCQPSADLGELLAFGCPAA